MMDRDTIKALIAKYNGQIESLKTTVRLLESELGTVHTDTDSTTNGMAARGNGKQDTPEGGVGHAWEFFNMSQPDAAEILLERRQHPMNIDELVDLMEAGGLKVGGETKSEKRNNLGTQLGRSGRFGRAARGTWGLPSWGKHIKPVVNKRAGKSDASGTDSGDGAVNVNAGKA